MAIALQTVVLRATLLKLFDVNLFFNDCRMPETELLYFCRNRILLWWLEDQNKKDLEMVFLAAGVVPVEVWEKVSIRFNGPRWGLSFSCLEFSPDSPAFHSSIPYWMTRKVTFDKRGAKCVDVCRVRVICLMPQGKLAATWKLADWYMDQIFS